MVKPQEAIKPFRNLFKERMMRSALADRIIRYIKSYREIFIVIILAFYLYGVVLLSSYFVENDPYHVVLSSYTPILLAFVRRKNPFGKDFWVEELGGSGPRVAAYLRVSTEKQARGLSLEVQKDKIDKMKNELKPSVIYWFVDAGVSGVDFDKRKLKKILELREKRQVDELWVSHIDRIGRTCRKSLLFFLHFSEDGGVIRTSEKAFTTGELADILIYTIESFGAESENKRRAERANASKIQNFKSRKWNKPIPLGYVRSGNWIAKGEEKYETLIKEIFNTFLTHKNLNKTARIINDKYVGGVLNKPLTRSRLKHILSDPVYVGRPTLMGVTLIDELLRYIDDETFIECQKLLRTKVEEKRGLNKLSTIAQLALTYDLSLLDFIEQVVDFYHRGCGGRLVRNGPRFEGLLLQQAFRCNLCGSEFRIPTRSMLNKSLNQEQHKPLIKPNDQRTHIAQREIINGQKMHNIAEKPGESTQKSILDFCQKKHL
jgi:DNA invertase Pin-like site-specific DNA recombinase/transposase-like protein